MSVPSGESNFSVQEGQCFVILVIPLPLILSAGLPLSPCFNISGKRSKIFHLPFSPIIRFSTTTVSLTRSKMKIRGLILNGNDNVHQNRYRKAKTGYYCVAGRVMKILGITEEVSRNDLFPLRFEPRLVLG